MEILVSVPPMLTISNQLEAAYMGQNVSLTCHTEAHPTSINYWTTERGDMIVSGTSSINKIIITNQPLQLGGPYFQVLKFSPPL